VTALRQDPKDLGEPETTSPVEVPGSGRVQLMCVIEWAGSPGPVHAARYGQEGAVL